MADTTCSHVTALTTLKEPENHECAECVKIGAQWVHLRTCQTCGSTLCCDITQPPRQPACGGEQASRNCFSGTG